MSTIRSPETESEWLSYYDLRYRVLREPWRQPKGSEKLADDDEATHVAYFDGDNNVIGCARLHKTKYFNDTDVGQIRLVAVHPDHQGKGIGRALNDYLEEEAKKSGLSVIILEARDNAVDFYERLGYVIIEKSYLLYGVIQHYMMSKTLSQKQA
ncbi:putative acetyltransferase [Halotydeus destructor]|nr:putative acetyltransferase [Halotydeus destructor]